MGTENQKLKKKKKDSRLFISSAYPNEERATALGLLRPTTDGVFCSCSAVVSRGCSSPPCRHGLPLRERTDPALLGMPGWGSLTARSPVSEG